MKVRKISSLSLSVMAILTYIFLWAPAVLLVAFSFSTNKYGVRWETFTGRWYLQMLDNANIKNALWNSLVVASVNLVLSIILGTIAAYGLYKYKFRGKRAIRISILFPIVIPYVVTAGALLVYFTRIIHVPLGYTSIIIAHVCFSFPLAVFVVLGRMQRIDWSLEEAASVLGADRFTIWRTVTAPLLWPAILASAALIFPWSFNDFTITYFVSGIGTTTLPIYVYSQIRYGSSPMINTIGTLFILLPIVVLLFMSLMQRKSAV